MRVYEFTDQLFECGRGDVPVIKILLLQLVASIPIRFSVVVW